MTKSGIERMDLQSILDLLDKSLFGLIETRSRVAKIIRAGKDKEDEDLK
jgi:hypothetical protein